MEFTIDNYISKQGEVLNSIEKANNLVTDTIISGKKIITCGNGGSASTASHTITDWNKMYNLAKGKKL